MTPLEQRRRKYMKRKSEFGDRSEETMAKLRQFTSTIRTAKQQQQQQQSGDAGGEETQERQEDGAVAYHGQVLEDDDAIDPEREKLELQNWFVGKLKCKKHIDDKYRNGAVGDSAGPRSETGADGRNVDDYLVIDPRKNRNC